MAFLIHLFILVTVFSSCSKMQYLMEQGRGQRNLLANARSNEEVLNDPKIPKNQKAVIKKVMKYKKYFYDFWGDGTSKIYDKTSFLKGEAVTYLVIASPHDEIKAKLECFPFVGCFPYLGFFKAESAKEHARNLTENGWITYIRPVYVYSTLGYFDDPILSSMFKLKEKSLAETVFHELFHTKFFIKNEVKINEAMANLVGEEMAEIYFGVSLKKEKKRYQQLDQWIVKKAQDLNQKYKGQKDLTPQKSQKIITNFLKEDFLPGVEKKCKFLKVACYPLKRTWNNAAFTGFLTYEENEGKLLKLKKKLGVDLRGFVEYLKIEYHKFKKSDKKVRKLGFSKFLKL